MTTTDHPENPMTTQTGTAPTRLDPAEVNYVYVHGPNGTENWTVHEWNAYVAEHEATRAAGFAKPAVMFHVTGLLRRTGSPAPPPPDAADPFAGLVLSPSARRVLAFLGAWDAAPVQQRGTRDTVSHQNSSGPDGGQRLLAGDLRELIHDHGKIHEFWAETEKQKRIIAALVEIIDGDQTETVACLPTVAASTGAIQELIDARSRHDEALKQARWIALEVPGDCYGEGCTVVDGACLDCGTKAAAR